MGQSRDTLTRSDLESLHEALSYQRKRVFEPAESVRLRGILDRLEDLILRNAGGARSLRLSPPEQEVLRRQILAYCEGLNARGASPASRRQAATLMGILEMLTSTGAATGWIRRLLGRKSS